MLLYRLPNSTERSLKVTWHLKEGTLFLRGGRIGARPALPTGCQCLLSHQVPFPLCTRGCSAPTSAHRCLLPGLGAGPLSWSSLCSEKVPAEGTPSPQREGHRMAASRPGTPPLGVPAPRRLPDAAGSQVGSRQVGRPPPQCPRGGRRLGEPLVLVGATRGSGGDPGRHLLAPRRLPRAEPAARHRRAVVSQGGRRGVWRSHGEMCQTELVSTSAPCQAVISSAWCHPGERG